ncbi:hypothetical protein ACJA28_03065 [Mesomycoplasma moatsii]|uniref:hypothetical protein n=1 Tax=Mesomycoplasma moatsii TaxID=171287 RepID=UPI0003B7436B
MADFNKNKVDITTTIDRMNDIPINFIGSDKLNIEILYNDHKNKTIESNNSKIITNDNKVYLSFTKQMDFKLKMLSKHIIYD